MMKQFNSSNNGNELAEIWKLLGFFLEETMGSMRVLGMMVR
jgi:hypothetical protein